MNLVLEFWSCTYDSAGNVLGLLSETGHLVEGYAYQPYGDPAVLVPCPGLSDPCGAAATDVRFDGHDKSSTGTYGTSPAVKPYSPSGNLWFFTGRQYDPEIGAYNYRAREYHPTLGQFMSLDPIGAWGDAANLGNAYAYVGNNPGSHRDPSGLATAMPCSAGAGMCSYDYLGNIAGTQAPGSTGQGCTGSFTEQAPGNACNPKLTDSAAVHVPLAIAHGVYEDTSAIVCSGTTMLAGCQDAPCHGTQGWNQLGCVGFHVANLALLAIPETRVIEATAERSILMDAEVGTRVGLGSGPKFHSVYEDGVRVLEGRQPARFGSLSGDPGAVGAHTRLRWDMDNGRIYAGREFNDLGQPVRDIDFTRPTFPSGLPRPNHFVPEQHLWSVNDPAVGPRSGWVRGPGEPFGW